MKGYKVFNPDWSCRGFKYEVGKSYELKGEVIICLNGFHFCEKLVNCFSYYKFNPANKVAIIEAYGDIVKNQDKSATNKITIVKELTWAEVLNMVNIGENCTGYANTGDDNSGNRNTGNENSGDYNTGDCNFGNRNTGCNNFGDKNTGDFNLGSLNVGDKNVGRRNVGYRNIGKFNTGDNNVGSSNTGDYNLGNFNTGDFNLTNYSTGCFNTERQTIKIFDKDTDMTIAEWKSSRYYALLSRIILTSFLSKYNLTEEELKIHPNGYLKQYSFREACKTWWDELTDNEKKVIRTMPNFDPKKFEMITGIKTTKVRKAVKE